jgi:hypothetical protein
MPSKELNLLIVSTGLAVNVYALNSVGYAIPMPGYGGHFQVSRDKSFIKDNVG